MIEEEEEEVKGQFWSMHLNYWVDFSTKKKKERQDFYSQVRLRSRIVGGRWFDERRWRDQVIPSQIYARLRSRSSSFRAKDDG